MRHLNLWLILSGALFALINRVVIPFGNVFTDHGIILNTPDAYYMVRLADLLPHSGIDYFSNYPAGAESLPQIVWAIMIKTMAVITGSHIAAAAILPPIIFGLTLLAVYLLASNLFNKTVAAMSIFILCLLPGEILTRTMLGAGDYHCLEALLMTAAIALIITAVKSNASAIYKGLLLVAAAGTILLYWLSWAGAVIILLIIGLAVLYWLFLNGFDSRSGKIKFIIVSIPILAGIIWMRQSETYSIVMSTIAGAGLNQTITECYPLFFTAGQFDITTMMAYYGLAFYLILFGIGWLSYRTVKYRRFADVLFLSYSLITFGMMLIYRRFDYYFAISGAIITAFVIYRLYQVIGRQHMVRTIIIFLAIISLPLAKQSVVVSGLSQAAPSLDWVNTCQWLQGQNTAAHERAYYNGSPPAYGTLAWWNYGYWLMGIGHQAVLCHGGTADNGCSDILLSTSDDDAIRQLRQLGMRYVVIDDDTLYNNVSLRVDNLESTFMYKAYTGQVKDLYLVYQSNDVKVYELK